MMFMFCVIGIYESETNKPVFQESSPSSPYAMRPLFIVLGKELLENLEDVKTAINERMNNTFRITIYNVEYTIDLGMKMTQIDGKM